MLPVFFISGLFFSSSGKYLKDPKVYASKIVLILKLLKYCIAHCGWCDAENVSHAHLFFKVKKYFTVYIVTLNSYFDQNQNTIVFKFQTIIILACYDFWPPPKSL